MSDYLSIQEEVEMYGDNSLLQGICQGDKHSFTILYHRYWEALFVTAAKALRSKEDAADVMQDIFLSLWNRRNEINIQGSLAAYLHTSVRYKCIHYIEKNITRRDYLLQLAEVEVSNSSPDAEVNLYLKQMEESVKKTVANMPTKMQEVYKLSRQQHLSYKQIADYMDISVETVKKHIQHALHVIRKNLPHTFIFIISSLFRHF